MEGCNIKKYNFGGFNKVVSNNPYLVRNDITNKEEKNINFKGKESSFNTITSQKDFHYLDRNYLDNYNYIKLGDKKINDKIYQVFKLQNGTIVKIRQDKDAKYNEISTSIKGAGYSPRNPNNKFQNLTESHLFEHMFFCSTCLSNGCYQTVDDGEDANSVRLIVKNEEENDIKNIVDKQMQQIYFAKFDQEVFDRERQTLNIELYHKKNRAGKRSEIENIDLNKLRQIRNSLVVPQNIEITVEGNVNPLKVVSDLSYTTANIKKTQINKLPDIKYERKDLYLGDEVADVEKICVVEKLQDFDDKKMIATLLLIKTLAFTSDKINLDSEIRALTYGTDIFIEKDKSKYIFGYSDLTFKDNANKLYQHFESNLQKLKMSEFTQEDLENAKRNLKLNPERFYYDEVCNLSKEELFESLEDISLADVQSIINKL